MVADCPKFIPNIFNNSKCSSCFKTREEHGDVALDSKALRKVVKCGYLFIAPRDWDFCNAAVYRAKRWQRRWFVLWSDDQLTWSIDDQPDTIPQGSLDMREILEVKGAEDVTENAYSLALTGKSATFIKGINNEDIKSWQSSLTKYGNRLITTGGGKRSLTLPGGFGGSSTNSSSSSSVTTRFETGVVIGPSRPRFHSHTTTNLVSPTSPSSPQTTSSSPPIPTPYNHAPTAEEEDEEEDEEVVAVPVPGGQSSSPQEYDKPSFIESPDVTDYHHSHLHHLHLAHSVRALRGDPDGCGGLDNLDGGPLRKGWLLRQTNNDWTKHWFVLQNNSLLFYENSEEGAHPLGKIEINEDTLIRQFESSRHYGFEIVNDCVHKLSAITNGMRGIWMKALEAAKSSGVKHFSHSHHRAEEDTKSNKEPSSPAAPSSPGSPPSSSVASPPSPPMKSRKSRWRRKTDLKLFESLKDEFNERERELEALRSELRVDSPRMRELLKSQALQIDNFRTQITSGFMEIEKLELICKNREAEYSESLKCKDEIIEEIREDLNRETSRREKLVEQSKSLDRQSFLLSSQLTDLKRVLRKTEEEADLENIHCKEVEALMEARNLQLCHEIGLLKHRINDLSEKLYQSEKTAKSLKTKLGRVKSQSLKDKQIESDVLSKIIDLEEKIGKLDMTTTSSAAGGTPSGSSPLSPTASSESGPGSMMSLSLSSITSPVPQSPIGNNPPSGASGGSGIVNVIMKLNDLDQRVDRAVDSYWFRRGELEELVGTCQSCKLLELELQDREERLEVMEENLVVLQSDFNTKVKELKEFVKEQPPSGSDSGPTPAQTVSKYQAEIEQLRNLCAKGLEAMENSHRRMVLELEEKHRRDIQNLKVEKENELAEETKATLSALDAMRKNHQSELQKEITKFKEEFMSKFSSTQDLSNLHKEHEQELREVRDEILRLSEKYSLKCVEASKLEETISYLKTQLNDAKRRILDLEGNDFNSICSSASNSNNGGTSSTCSPGSKKPDQVTALRSRLEHLILSRPLHHNHGGGSDEAKAKAQNDASGYKGGSAGSTPSGEGGGLLFSASNSTPKKPRSSIIRSPSCPKLSTGEIRLSSSSSSSERV